PATFSLARRRATAALLPPGPLSIRARGHPEQMLWRPNGLYILKCMSRPARGRLRSRRVTIRTSPSPPQSQSPDVKPSPPEQRPERTGPRRKTVLIVEDNASFGGLLVALLREEGYRALRAWDGREAIKMARDRPPDLIVLDLSLPYRDGVEVLRELRANAETTEAPIVVVSGNALQLTPDDRQLVSETVTKPFDIDRLMNVFRRLLGDEEVAVPERGYDKTDSHLNSW